MIQMNWSKLSNKPFILTVFFVFYSISGTAQKSFQDTKNLYSDYNEIILDNSELYDISIENNGLKIIQDNHYESMILTQNGIFNNKESFSYSGLIPLKSYDAYTVINENGKEKKIKVTQTIEKQSQQSSVFYNDVKERQLTFPNIETGAKKVYNYQTQFLDPHLLHKFIFGNALPIQNSTLEVRTEKNIVIDYKIFNDPDKTIAYSKTEKKGKWIHKWTLSNIKPVKFEEDSPGYLYQIPHVDFYVKEYTINNKTTPVLGDIPELFNYYKDFVKTLNEKEDPNLKALTLELVKNKNTEEEKVKSIFYWVKENIKYIAFENGYEGFIPREASLVFERKFGDCKDMASIISCMAKYADVKNVTIAWIGTRSIPYSYNDLATPSVDNHMIAVFKKGNDYIFLDGTDKETRYGIPTAFIQGKEVLFSENDQYKIYPVPVVPANQNEIKETVNLKIDNTKLVGTAKTERFGYNRSHVLMQIGDASNKARQEMIKSLVLKGNNKFNLKDFKEENLNDKELPYIIDYSFDLDNYIVKVDKEIYVSLFLDKLLDKTTIAKDRVSQYEFDYLTQFTTQYILEIPKNCSIKYLPKNFDLDNDYIKAHFTYELKNNTLFLNVSLAQKKLLLNKADFEPWNETIKKLKTNYNETIILLEK
jgi:transglutaminase-like putative cysteine protease